MNALRQKLLSLCLVLAWVLAPTLHELQHAEEAHEHQGPPACQDHGPQGHWHEADTSHAPCELCHVLGQRATLPLATALPQPRVLGALADEAELSALYAFLFPYFDRRGPPILSV